MVRSDIQYIPYDDQVVSDLNLDEKNACNLALQKMDAQGETTSLLTSIFGYGTSDWVYRRDSDYAKSSCCDLTLLTLTRVVLSLPLAGVLYDMYFQYLIYDIYFLIWIFSYISVLLAFVSLYLTIFSSYYPQTFTVFTSIFCEVSIAFNCGATIGFWVVLVPVWYKTWDHEHFLYMASMHGFPILSHLVNSAITYENFQTDDWKVALCFLMMYSYFNIIGSFDMGIGVYAPVIDWFANPVIAAVFMGLLVGVAVLAFNAFIKYFNSIKTSKK